jgi:hypothetical protein
MVWIKVGNGGKPSPAPLLDPQNRTAVDDMPVCDDLIGLHSHAATGDNQGSTLVENLHDKHRRRYTLKPESPF